MWLLVNHTKHFLLKVISLNGGPLQNSGQLQNNSVNSAMLITINRLKSKVNKHLLSLEQIR